MTEQELQAKIDALTAENEALKASKQTFTLKVSEKTGAISVYGLSRFPVTLYRGQMERLLDKADTIREFIKANEGKLAVKAPK